MCLTITAAAASNSDGMPPDLEGPFFVVILAELG